MPLIDLGQDRAVRAFRTAWQQGRLAHSYALVGPPGIGRAAFARGIAQALLCQDAPDADDFCGTCSLCRRIAKGQHPDVVTYRPPAGKRVFPIEVVRELLDRVYRRPFEAPLKVCVVSEAEEMNDAAANTFLKTLEEPPPRTFLLLLVADLDRLLPTIRSRTQVLRLAPRSAAALDAKLDTGETSPGPAGPALAALSGGSPGRMQALLKDDFAAVAELVLGWLRGDPSAPPFDAAADLLKAATHKSDATKEPTRRRLADAAVLVALWMRDAIGLTTGGAAAGSPPAAGAATAFAHLNASTAAAYGTLMLDLAAALALNVHIKLWTEHFVAAVLAARRGEPARPLRAAVDEAVEKRFGQS